MDKRIEITRHDHGFTIADNRTGLRVECFEEVNGLSFEAYGYHSRTPQPVMILGPGSGTIDDHGFLIVEPSDDRPHPEVTIRMPDPKPVIRTRAR